MILLIFILGLVSSTFNEPWILREYKTEMVVTSCADGSAIDDALIYFTTKDSLTIQFAGFTKANGSFTIENFENQDYIIVKKLGYQNKLISVRDIIKKASICLEENITQLNEIEITSKQLNPLVSFSYSGKKIKITQKEISVKEFEEFINETNYKTKIERDKLKARFIKGFETFHPINSNQFRRIRLKFIRYSQGNFAYNSKNKFKGTDWKLIVKESDTLKWYHNQFGKDMRIENPNYPVHYITYDDAIAFANWAGGRLPNKHEYTILTNDIDLKNSWIRENTGGFIFSTGSSNIDNNQLYDIGGNLAEYVYNEPSSEVLVLDLGTYGSRFRKEDIFRAYQTNSDALLGLNKVGFRIVYDD